MRARVGPAFESPFVYGDIYFNAPKHTRLEEGNEIDTAFPSRHENDENYKYRFLPMPTNLLT
jgi:hypothetical protein